MAIIFQVNYSIYLITSSLIIIHEVAFESNCNSNLSALLITCGIQFQRFFPPSSHTADHI